MMLWTPARPAPTLRPYQDAAIAQLDAAVAAGARAPLLTMPTGAGKTVVAAALIARAVAAGQRVLFVAPRRELVAQTARHLDDFGVDFGVVLAAAGIRGGLGAPVQVAGLDTLLSRVVRRQEVTLDPVDLVVIDEAHLSITKSRVELFGRWPDALRIGLTATPTRKDGRALGLLYDTLLEPTSIADLTAAGHLVRARYFSWPTPDLRGVPITAGDYHQGQLAALMNAPKLLGDIVEHWLAHAAGRRTVVFATSIAHAIALAASFRGADVAAEHVDAGTPTLEREAIFARFRRGATQVLTNCFLASYGFDLPALSCVVLARPTRSLMLYLQMVGRGLRPADGKRDCLVLDHSGAVHRHGFAADERRWTLEGTSALVTPPARPREPAAAKECPECSAIWTGSPTCPECGFALTPRGRLVPVADGALVELGAAAAAVAEDRCRFYCELRHYGAMRGYKPGWAAATYRDRYEDWPPWAWNRLPPLEPSGPTRGWIRHRLIAWAKGRRVPRGAGADGGAAA